MIMILVLYMHYLLATPSIFINYQIADSKTWNISKTSQDSSHPMHVCILSASNHSDTAIRATAASNMYTLLCFPSLLPTGSGREKGYRGRQIIHGSCNPCCTQCTYKWYHFSRVGIVQSNTHSSRKVVRNSSIVVQCHFTSSKFSCGSKCYFVSSQERMSLTSGYHVFIPVQHASYWPA